MLKNFSLFLALLAFVFLVNLPVLSFDMLYPEQPLLYLANQKLHSWGDLWNIYQHPQMFHLSILFFRPSGHFLTYQLLEPFLGWHNTRGFLMINLVFLSLTGFFMAKLYEALFPGFKLGGYLAFSIYLMHPALMLSRLISLHFEFAHVFFVVLSLYCFVSFCKAKQRINLLLASLFCYALAVSYKEASLMLGPVLMVYYALQADSLGLAFWREKLNRQVIALIMVVGLALGFYLSLQWPSLIHPLHKEIHWPLIFSAGRQFLSLLFGLGVHFFPHPAWRNVVYPLSSTLILSSLLILSLGLSYFSFRRSLLFLYLAAALFALLPFFWGWGLPWHLSLSLLCLSLIMGFSAEYLAKQLLPQTLVASLLIATLAFVVGLNAIQVNQVNIAYLQQEQGFALEVGRNAVLHPPQLGANLKTDSILVVEDSILKDSYLLGASFYPFTRIQMNNPNLDNNKEAFERLQASFYIKQEPIYNGSLFRWAYLKPELQEEVVPFQVDQLAALPDLIIEHWAEHFDQLICLGYDEKANWQDKTEVFKRNLLVEKKKRKLG